MHLADKVRMIVSMNHRSKALLPGSASALRMKTTLDHLIATLLVVLSVLMSANAAPEFFVFDNGVGRGKWTPEQQARTLKELGYAGISYNYSNPEDLALWQAAFKEQGLRIYGLYFIASLGQPQPYDSRLPEAIRMLRATGTTLWMAIGKPKIVGDHEREAVKLVQTIADLAAESGARVALYGHAGFYTASASDALRLAEKVQRPNVRPSINLCHEFMSGRADQLDETLKAVAPGAILASINGVDVPTRKYILRLDQGDFDMVSYLKKLLATGYTGPVGLQCYNVPGDIRDNLAANISAWRKIASRLDEQPTTQTQGPRSTKEGANQ